MHSMIIIIQTFTTAMAFEYGPYPNLATCEQDIPRHEAYIREVQPTTMAMIADCRDISAQVNSVEDRGVVALPDGVS